MSDWVDPLCDHEEQHTAWMREFGRALRFLYERKRARFRRWHRRRP